MKFRGRIHKARIIIRSKLPAVGQAHDKIDEKNMGCIINK